MNAAQVLDMVQRVRRGNPALYAQLRVAVPAVDDLFAPAMGDFSSAISMVGDWLSKNSAKLVDTAGKVIVARKQAEIAKANAKLQAAQQQQAIDAYAATAAGGAPPPGYTGQLTPRYPIDFAPRPAGIAGALSQPVLGVPAWGWLAGGLVGLMLWRQLR